MSGIIASSNYSPGDLIYREKSFAKVLQRKLKDVACESCGKTPLDLKACKQCLAVKYCGRSCQRKDWSSHKLECQYLKNLPAEHQDLVRLLGKVILKLKDKDWKDIKQEVFGKECTFDDISSHCEEFITNRRLNLFFKEMKQVTGNYIGFENMPDDEHFLKIIGKVERNVISSREREICLFLGVSAFERECIPNTSVVFDGDEVMVIAIRSLRKGVDKIFLPFREVLSTSSWLNDDKESCKCSDCSLPYSESILSKIIDEEKAFTIIEDTEKFLELAAILPNLCSHSGTEEIVDEMLQKQEGVLGDTHYLRLRLMAFKCLTLGGNPHSTKRPLMELEKIMSSVFGEFYNEMLPIYNTLSMIHFQLGDPFGGASYLQKVTRILGMIPRR